MGSNFVSLPGRRFPARRKDVSFDFSVGKVNLVRITGFFTAISRFLTIGKFQFPGDFLVEEADIKKGCSFNDGLHADVITDISITFVFQAVFAGGFQDGIGFRGQLANTEGNCLFVAAAFVVSLVVNVAEGLRGVFIVTDGKVLVALVGFVGAVVHRVPRGDAKRAAQFTQFFAVDFRAFDGERQFVAAAFDVGGGNFLVIANRA